MMKEGGQRPPFLIQGVLIMKVEVGYLHYCIKRVCVNTLPPSIFPIKPMGLKFVDPKHNLLRGQFPIALPCLTHVQTCSPTAALSRIPDISVVLPFPSCLGCFASGRCIRHRRPENVRHSIRKKQVGATLIRTYMRVCLVMLLLWIAVPCCRTVLIVVQIQVFENR
jgi:hypothetical protein